VNRFKLMMHDGRAEDGRNFGSVVVPPFNQIGHHWTYLLRRRRHISTHPHTNGSILPGRPLIHDLTSHDAMQLQYFRMRDDVALRILFHEAQASKIICYLPGSGLPSMAVEECALRMRVSFCNAGIHGTSIAAARMRSRNAATCSTCESKTGEML
jgi:hypothetical protein